jgi:metal-responsive CopG/Arc/MetJ family transcriptional regulator
MAIKKITIAIDENIVNTIDERAKQAKRSRSNYLECAIEEYLNSENNEKQLQEKIAELETEIKILKAVPPANVIVQPAPTELHIETKKVEKAVVPTKLPSF